MVAGLLISMVESIGDYHTCAKMCDVRKPPKHALNRGKIISPIVKDHKNKLDNVNFVSFNIFSTYYEIFFIARFFV